MFHPWWNHYHVSYAWSLALTTYYERRRYTNQSDPGAAGPVPVLVFTKHNTDGNECRARVDADYIERTTTIGGVRVF